MPFHPNGLGQDLGDSLAVVGSPLYTTGEVWYVNSAGGSDSYDGRNHLAPLATTSQAITNASAGDVIVLMDGHTETLSSVISISKALTIVGGGQSDGKPTANFTASSSNNIFSIEADNVQIRNIYFKETTYPNSSGGHINVQTGSGLFLMEGNYHECGVDMTHAVVLVSTASGPVSFRNTTFVNTGTDATDPPLTAIDDRQGYTGVVLLDGCTFDGGTIGWTAGYAYTQDGGAANTVFADRITHLRGADVGLISTTTGYWQVSSSSDEPRIDWGLSAGGG